MQPRGYSERRRADLENPLASFDLLQFIEGDFQRRDVEVHGASA